MIKINIRSKYFFGIIIIFYQVNLPIKELKFKNFQESQNFVNKVGNLAEEENHHPDISFGWGYCKIKIFNHHSEDKIIIVSAIDNLIKGAAGQAVQCFNIAENIEETVSLV